MPRTLVLRAPCAGSTPSSCSRGAAHRCRRTLSKPVMAGRRLAAAAGLFLLLVSRASAGERPHPLDPLGADEIATAVAVLGANGKTTSASRFPLVALHEPPKPGPARSAPPRREAFVVVYERDPNRTLEAVVDLEARHVMSWREMRGVQPPILMEEYALTGEIVRADPRWTAALRRRGILDLGDVHADPWPPGHEGTPEARHGRIVKV